MVTWPLPSDTVKGWWNKLLIFNPVVQDTAFRRYERILLLDLDKVIVGNCDFLLDVPDVELVMIKDFFYPENYGGALINLKNGCGHEVWQGFMDDMEGVVGAHFGEQVWIEKCMKGAIFYQDLHPGALASFKAHQCREGYPEGTGIVCFHGRPMPHEVEDIGWVKRCWA